MIIIVCCSSIIVLKLAVSMKTNSRRQNTITTLGPKKLFYQCYRTFEIANKTTKLYRPYNNSVLTARCLSLRVQQVGIRHITHYRETKSICKGPLLYVRFRQIHSHIFIYLLLSSNIAKSSKVPSRYNNDVESNCRNKLV